MLVGKNLLNQGDFSYIEIDPLVMADPIRGMRKLRNIYFILFLSFVMISFLFHNRYVKKLHFPMDLASTLPFQQIYQILARKPHERTEFFGLLNMLRLWRLRRVSELFARYIHKSEIRTKAKETNEH